MPIVQIRVAKHTAWRIFYRYMSGRPLDGEARTSAGYLRPGRRVLHPSGHASGWAMLPGWQRQAWRLGLPAAGCGVSTLYLTHPDLTLRASVAVLTVAGIRTARRIRTAWRMRRFNAAYITPTMAALTGALGDAPVRLHVSPELGNLVPRLAKPMSPAEKAARIWYGQHLEPVLRWLPDRIMRTGWAIQRTTRPATRWLELFRRPQADDIGPRIQLQTSVPYLTDEQRRYVSSVIGAKIPVADLTERWDQVGAQVAVTWTVRRRPPARVGYPDLSARFAQLAEWEFFLGLGVGGKPIKISLREDSPHIACSAGSGAGKSVLAQTVAVQVLARGGRVVILDVKGSHRWALNLAGVDYCTQADQMHTALLALARIADERNSRALYEAEDWDPGQRIFVIAEELNATFTKLKDHWSEIGRGTSPAVKAFRELLFMGRSAKVNVFAVAQMLTAHTTGGPESRENFGIRALARYTKNNWQMLAPEAAMPRVSRTLGRWQIVVGGVASECQVAYLTPAEARLFVYKYAPVSPHPHSPLIGADQQLSPGHRDSGDTIAAPTDPLSETITLRQAVERGISPWAFEATKKRLQRARKNATATVPAPVGKDGQADTYRVGDLVIWIEAELVA